MELEETCFYSYCFSSTRWKQQDAKKKRKVIRQTSQTREKNCLLSSHLISLVAVSDASQWPVNKDFLGRSHTFQEMFESAAQTHSPLQAIWVLVGLFPLHSSEYNAPKA